MAKSKPLAPKSTSVRAFDGGEFPQVFGKYVLLRPMARGGMGELFLAAAGEVGGFEKLCVLKKVLGDLEDQGVRRRFLDEAKVVVRLNHANLVQVFDAGRVGDEYYMAMELVEGKDLRASWNRCAQLHRRIPIEFAIFVVREICRGLDYVHDSMGLELVHRDISPPNILVSYHGQVKITDFGLAKHTNKRELTLPGVVYGRYSYLAPEQARGQPADRRTDIYAAGIVLWEMLTGRQLFPLDERAYEGKTLAALRNPQIRLPSEMVPGIPDGLDRVIKKALEVERVDRYQTAGEFRSALSEILSRQFPSFDMDRVADFMREIFAHERKIEAQDYASYAREDFSRVRGIGQSRATVSVATDHLPVGGRDATVVTSIPLDDKDIVEFETREYQNNWDSANVDNLQSAAAMRIHMVVAERYRLDRLLGIGGMGAVYVATHLALGKTYALKILHNIYDRDLDISARFMREARAATQTGHPNIIDVVDIGTTQAGDLYFVMELLDGTDLAQIIATQGSMAIRRVVHIGRQICRALGAAHDVGIIHRDLKSENVMIVKHGKDPDFVKVLDFGICKQMGTTNVADTSPGMVMGSPDYMAPEQAAGMVVDTQTDIYALGTVLFEMLTSKLPFDGRNAIDILMRKGREDAPDIRELRSDIPPALADIVMRCLERARELRPSSMRALEYELTRAIEGRASAVAAAMGMQLPEYEESPGRHQDHPDDPEVHSDRPDSVSATIPTGSGTAVEPVPLPIGPASTSDSSETAESSSGNMQVEAWPPPPQPSPVVGGVKALFFVFLGVVLMGSLIYQFAPEFVGSRSPSPISSDSRKPSVGVTNAPELKKKSTDNTAEKQNKKTANLSPAKAPTTSLSRLLVQGNNDSVSAVETDTSDQSESGSSGSAKPGLGVQEEEAESAVAAIVRRAEGALAREHWRDPPEGSLMLELSSLVVEEPGSDAIVRLRNEAAKILAPKGKEAVEKERWQEAVGIYRNLVGVWPNNKESRDQLIHALLKYSDELYANGDFATVTNLASELINFDEWMEKDKMERARKLRADALFELKRWDDAELELKKLKELRPKDRKIARRLREVARNQSTTKPKESKKKIKTKKN